MNERLRFRAFCEQDRPSLERMVQGLYADDPSTEGMTVEKIHRTFGELLRQPERGTFILFESGEAAIGYALVIHYWSNEYGGTIEVIDELFVDPAWRGRGVASAFLDCLADTSSEVKGLQLEVTPRNARARALYTRHGFRTAKNEHMFRKLGE